MLTNNINSVSFRIFPPLSTVSRPIVSPIYVYHGDLSVNCLRNQRGFQTSFKFLEQLNTVVNSWQLLPHCLRENKRHELPSCVSQFGRSQYDLNKRRLRDVQLGQCQQSDLCWMLVCIAVLQHNCCDGSSWKDGPYSGNSCVWAHSHSKVKEEWTDFELVVAEGIRRRTSEPR